MESMAEELAAYLNALERGDSYRVDRVLSSNDAESTEVVYFVGAHGGGQAHDAVQEPDLIVRVLLQDLHRPAGHAAPDLDVLELVPPVGQGLVQGRRKRTAMAVIYPVAVLYDLHRLLCRAELFSVLAVYVHSITSYIANF